MAGTGIKAYESSVLSEEESGSLNEKPFDVEFDYLKGVTDLRKLADASIEKIGKMVDTGVRARQTRFGQIRKNEDMYNGNTPPALKGRSNVPFDCIVMGGFVDTLMANVDEPIDLTYGATRESGRKSAKRMTALFKQESGTNKGNWDDQMYNSKLLAALSGRGFAKLHVDNVPKFKTDFTIPDHYDMVTEPQGGYNLDRHLFKFEQNIFRSKGQLREGTKNGFYDARQVAKLVGSFNTASPEFKKMDDAYRNKLERFAALGSDVEAEGFVGQELYRLTEGVVSINNKWYYVVFQKETNTWVYFNELGKVFPWADHFEGRGAWSSWATHRHPFLFWTRAPADDIRAIGYTVKKIMNLTIDELEKNIWDMKAYDPRIFTNPTDLLYKQDALARATLKQGQKIQDGIYRFQTGDHSGITINLMQFLDQFLGQKTGITSDSMGDSNEKILGIQVNNLAQSSKRMRLTNRMYSQMYNDMGLMFDHGVWGRLRESVAIKLIGADGADWDETFTRDDANEEFTIQVRAGADSLEQSLIGTKKRSEFFDSIETNATLAGKVNSSAFIRFKARDAGFEEDDIDLLLDVKNEADEDVMSDAAKAIEDCIADKPYRIYRDANVAFVEKIYLFATKHYQVIPTDQLKKMSKSQRKEYTEDMAEFDRLIHLIKLHMPYVKKNAAQDFTAGLAASGGMEAVNGFGQGAPKSRMTPEMMQMLMAKGGSGGGAPGPDGGAPVPAPAPEGSVGAAPAA